MSNFDENREWANQISEKLEHSDSSTIIEYFTQIEKTWTLTKDISNNFEIISKNFNIKNTSNSSNSSNCFENVDANFIETEKNKIIWEFTGISNKFKKLINMNESENEHYKIRWEKLLETFYYSEQLIRTFYLLDRIKEDKYEYSLNEDCSALFKFVPINYDKNTGYQNLLLYLLQDLSECDYAKYSDTLYKKIKSKEGFPTYAWEPHMKIKNFIIEKCRKNSKFDQWKNMTERGGTNLKQAIEYLLDCPDEELLKLEKDRHIFSFKNGVFLTKINKGTEAKPYWGSLFIPYGTQSEYLNSKTVSSKYFDEDFNDFTEVKEDDWFDIINKCPNFKKVLDYQEFPKEVQLWLCIFIGKCCYDIGELENWQAVMYLLGQAGAGKSTILTKIIQKFYEEVDVGMISNNIEKQYGLKPNINKFVVLAPEMQGDCKLEQTDWQLIVEGGKNTFAEKYKNAESEYWKVPMAMAGNQLIKYKNPSEQVSRRTVVFNFWKKVTNTDTHLDRKLEKEIPNIMKLCVTGYLWAINKYGEQGIWKILPKYFHEKKDEMEQTTNALQHFLRSSKVVLDATKYIPEKIFKQTFNEHCRENNLAKEQWSTDYYSSTFSNNSIQIKKNTKRKYPANTNEHITGTFFVGVDIIDENNNDDEQEPE